MFSEAKYIHYPIIKVPLLSAFYPFKLIFYHQNDILKKILKKVFKP